MEAKTSAEQGMRRAIADAARAHDLRAWRETSLVYADMLADELDRPAAADRRRYKVASRRTRGVLWPRACSVEGVSDHQREKLACALSRPVGVLAGTPGTGKTFTTGALVREIARRHGIDNIAICAPTGKAAVRVSESMARCGVRLSARTIHSLLEIGRNGHDGDGWGFLRNAENPLDEQFVIVDEASMLDTTLASDLFAACAPGTQVLLVGDPYQLPPVGHGAPLRDLISSGVVGYGELSEIRRNAGLIVRACSSIKDGKTFDQITNHERITEEANLLHLEARDQQSMLDRLRFALAELAGYQNRSNLFKHCVIVPTNKLRKEINGLLQGDYNPDGETATPNPFRAGDKIICLRNHVAEEAWFSNRQSYLANGEIGLVETVQPKLTVASFQSPNRMVRIPMGKPRDEDSDDDSPGTGCHFDLAYAITGHKCVHPDTLVETAEGLIPIREISPQGEIATPHGRHPYLNYVSNPAGPAVVIGLEGGYSLTVTPEHRMEVWNGKAYELKEASEVKLGDMMRLKLGATIDVANEYTLPPLPSGDVRATMFRVPATVDEDVAEFLGLMVADGTVWRCGFRLLKRHRDVAIRFRELCCKLFGVNPGDVALNGATGFEVRSTRLAAWLASLGGLLPNAKDVPPCILRSPLRVQAAFIRGLFEDGTVNVKEGLADHIQWSSCNPSLVSKVRIMLLRLGVISGTVKGREKSDVMIYSASMKRLRDETSGGFVSEFKRQRLELFRASENRYRIPISRTEAEWMHSSKLEAFGEYRYRNAKLRGYISRETARKSLESGGPVFLEDRLAYHHARTVSVEPTVCESRCVEVPGVHRFLQNGIVGSNSQGSEWPVVIVLVDDSYGARQIQSREWIYTAISRASRLCITIGQRSVLEQCCKRPALDRRKTFLREMLQGTVPITPQEG